MRHMCDAIDLFRRRGVHHGAPGGCGGHRIGRMAPRAPSRLPTPLSNESRLARDRRAVVTDPIDRLRQTSRRLLCSSFWHRRPPSARSRRPPRHSRSRRRLPSRPTRSMRSGPRPSVRRWTVIEAEKAAASLSAAAGLGRRLPDGPPLPHSLPLAACRLPRSSSLSPCCRCGPLLTHGHAPALCYRHRRRAASQARPAPLCALAQVRAAAAPAPRAEPAAEGAPCLQPDARHSAAANAVIRAE